LAACLGVLSFLLSRSLLATTELFASDQLFRLRGIRSEDTPIVLIAIDDATFDQSGLQWPWPRDYIARIIDGIAAGQPEVIALDILFYEATTAEQDAELARALADAGNVILVNDIATEIRGSYVTSHLNRPIPELDAVSTLGLTNFPRDEDGEVRRLLAFQAHNEQLYYAWSMQAARLYLGVDDFTVVSANEVWIGDRRVSLDNQYLTVNYRGPAAVTIPVYSAYQVVEGYVDPSVFTDKIVILGATSESLHDNYATPFGADPPMPGAEINAHAIDTILNGLYISHPGLLAELLLALLGGGIGVVLTLRARPVGGFLLVLALMAGYGLLAYVLFGGASLMLPIIGPTLSVFLVFVANTSIQLYEEQRERARVRGLFERYVSPAAIDQMLARPDSYALGGQRREMTILFSDIRGFTALSEKLSPDQVVEILNEYLGAMTEIIFRHAGTVDKFEGDAILAIWNAPLEVLNHPDRAVKCAIEMAQHLAEMQKEWAATGHVILRNGIGIATGNCFVGNIGSAQRMDYTVIGDVVNLAARLEALTKEVGVQILFTASTREALSADIHPVRVTAALVKGREQPVEVFTVDPVYHNLPLDPGVDLEQIPERLVQIEKD
jgi:adenylate cyclase